MAKIKYQGNEWDLDYFIAATEFLEGNLGESPSTARVKRVEARKQAISELMDPKPTKKKGRKKPENKDLESVPVIPED